MSTKIGTHHASSRQGSTNRLSQPTFSFSYQLYVVSLPLRISVLQDYGGAHSLVMDALAEMSEAHITSAVLMDTFCQSIHKLHNNFCYLLVLK